MAIRVLIVDDEPLARQRLKRMLEPHSDYQCVGELANGQALLDWLQSDLLKNDANLLKNNSERSPNSKADIVLLDIQMPGIDGMQAASQLSAITNAPVVIFCTAFDDYALPAFKVDAVDYLLKPIRGEDLTRALDRAQRRLLERSTETQDSRINNANARTHISVRKHDSIQLIELSSVSYFSADQKYVSMHHDDGEALIDDSLKQLEEEFADSVLRIHRSYLVMAQRIDRLEIKDDGCWLYLRGTQSPLPVSRRHLAQVKRQLKQI
ncbi:MAG: LytTR family DNA-binding domain-containing protein [Oleibacter sp.]|nr:LytTR family DNA-binding domain-containing protein [Thalassolituus sp.]